MQNIYFVSYEINGERIEVKRYLNDQEAMNAAKSLMINKAKEMKVGEYLSAIRTGKYHTGYINKNYRTLVARYLREFFSTPEAVSVTCDYVCSEDPNDYVSEKYADMDTFDDFTCYCEAGCTVLECYFGDKLMIDSNFVTCINPDAGYFRIKDANTDFKVNIDLYQTDWFYADGSSKSQNMLLVYLALESETQTLEDIQKKIQLMTGEYIDAYAPYMKPAYISTKTISEQLELLKQLGFPITYTYRSGTALDPINLEYHIKPHSLKAIPDVDASDIGTSAYLMLVLMTLVRTGQAMSASEIIEYISEHFKVNMSKSTVLRHLAFLVSVGWVSKTDSGVYVWKKVRER